MQPLCRGLNRQSRNAGSHDACFTASGQCRRLEPSGGVAARKSRPKGSYLTYLPDQTVPNPVMVSGSVDPMVRLWDATTAPAVGAHPSPATGAC